MATSILKQIGRLLHQKKKGGDEEDPEATDGEDKSLKVGGDTADWKVGDHAVVHLDGVGDTVVPRGDMSDDDWGKFIDQARKSQRLRSESQVGELRDEKGKRAGADPKVEDKPKSDYMEVYVGKGSDQKAVVPRGDMDQSSWEEVKRRAKKMGIFSGSNDTIKDKVKEGIATDKLPPESDTTGFEKDIPTPEEMQRRREADGKNPEPDEQMKEDTQLQRSDASGDGPGGVRGFVQKGLLGATDADRRGAAPQSTEEALAAQSAAKRPASAGTAQDLSGVPLTKRIGKAVGEGVRSVADAALNTPGTFIGTGSLSDSVIKGAKMLPDIAKGAGEIVGAAVDPASVTAGAPPPAAGPPQLGPEQGPVYDPSQLGKKPAAAPAGAGAGAPAPLGPGPAAPNEIPSRQGEIDQAFKDSTRAQMAIAARDEQAMRMKGEEFDRGLNEQVRQQAKIADIQERARKEREAPMQIYSKLVTELMQPSEKIDPHRWWNSRSTGQKIMLALGSLMTKGGNVQMIQHAIDADMQVQQNDITNTRDRQRMALSSSDNMIRMIRENGADDVQAAKIYSAMSWDMVSKRLEMIAANTDSQEVKQKAEMNIAEANVKRNQILGEMDKYNQDLAIRKEKNQIDWAELNLKRQKMGQGKKLERLKGPQVDKIAALQTAVEKLDDMSRKLNAVQGSTGEAIVNKGTSVVPGSKSNRFNYDAELNIANLADTLGNAGVLQSHEVTRWKDIHPKAGDMDAKYRIQSIRADMARRLQKELEAFKAAGYDVSQLSGGEAPSGPSSFQPDEAEQ